MISASEETKPGKFCMKFKFHNPTHLIFGAGTLSKLEEEVGKNGKKALIVTGGGSVKHSGAFDRAVASLKEAGVAMAECSGIEPNPQITSVRRGVRIARDESCDVVVALGGGNATQVQWTSVVALNGWLQAGVEMVPPVHMIEHALSTHHDITHGAGLAVVNPTYMRPPLSREQSGYRRSAAVRALMQLI
jgi:alcohol dehydrogenase YqhD (iron-dependent ADH family)